MTTLAAHPDTPRRLQSKEYVRAASLIADLPLTLVLVWAVSLSRSLFDPIGFDQALYQYITERVMLGDRLYTDVWDQNMPGIIGVHWLSTMLVGRSPMALRGFDACWQMLTLAALITLGGRDGGRWRVGWLAAILYALAYYGLGYIHTAQREGFAVLPLLLAVHAMGVSGRTSALGGRPLAGGLFAGVMGFAAFVIKPTLGLCFGVMWLVAIANGLRAGKRGGAGWQPAIGLTSGFIGASVGFIALMHHLEWWDGFWPVLLRQDLSGYVAGPALLREMAPNLFVSTVLLGILGVGIAVRRVSEPGTENRWIRHFPLRETMIGVAVVALVVSLHDWPGWQQPFARLAGVLMPAAGAIALAQWQIRSSVWKLIALLAIASFAGILWQGWFYLYHFPPVLAFAAYLTAHQLTEGWSALRKAGTAAHLWPAVCVGLVVHLAVNTWGHTMTFHTRSPYVLAGTKLEAHWTEVTKHKSRFPTYATTAETAACIQRLTHPADPIACLLDEPRVYYFAQRPPVFPLLRTQDCYRNQFPALLASIMEKRPKVVVARLPHTGTYAQTTTDVEAALYDHLAERFGPAIFRLQDTYKITEIVNEDVCILQPLRTDD